jgi:tRNA 5-methylaminomethyl-2-thiouridine biosynthesis bifunctional protein
MTGVVPQELAFDPTGAPYSGLYGDVYASRDGALGQARHVFLGGNRLPQRWGDRRQFVIVETGFGLGTNFLATWQAWRDDPRRPRRLHFVSLEKHPLPAAQIAGQAPPALAALAAQLAAAWPLALGGLHRLEFESGGIVLTLGFGDARDLVPALIAAADAYYLDGFSPARNPDLWSPPLIKALARLALPDATFATYSAARPVRDALAAAGFEVESAPGYGHKREMLVGRFAPRWRVRRHEPAAPYEGTRAAIVIGGGLAGAACAEALARRGWSVRVLERSSRVADGASALPAGLLHPHPSLDDGTAARLSRAGFLYAHAALQRHDPGGVRGIWLPCGVYREAGDPPAEDELRELAARLSAPAAYLEYLTASGIAPRLGVTARHAGLWFERGAVVSAARWCEAMLGTPGIEVSTSADVVRLRRQGGCWLAEVASGATFEAPVVVLANSLGAARLLDFGVLPIAGVPGRVSLLSAGDLGGLRAAIAGDGYVVPAFGDHPPAVGASYETPLPGLDQAGELDPGSVHEANLARLDRLVQRTDPVRVSGFFAGVRCVARDRTPLAGPIVEAAAITAPAVRQRLRGAHLADLPRLPGAFSLIALGSRGLTLAPLLGELVAAGIEGEPAPLTRDLAAAVDPARFTLRRLRAPNAGGAGD